MIHSVVALLAVSAAAATAMVPPSAIAATSTITEAGWAEPQAISSPARQARPLPQLTVNAAGLTVATWWERPTGAGQIKLAVRPAGSATWDTTGRLAVHGTKLSADLRTILLDNDRIAVVWRSATRHVRNTYQIWMREVRADGSLTKAALVQDVTHYYTERLTLGGAPDGGLVVTTARPDDVQIVFEGSLRDGFTQVDLSEMPVDPVQVIDLRAFVDADGEFTVVGRSGSGAGVSTGDLGGVEPDAQERLMVFRSTDREHWSSEVLAPRAGSSIRGGDFVVNTAGDIGVTWAEVVPGHGPATLAGYLDASDDVLHVQLLDNSPPCQSFFYFVCIEFGLGQGGEFVVVWERDAADGGDGKDVVLRRRDPATGAWSSRQVLLSGVPEIYDDPDTYPDGVSVAASGEAIVGWKLPPDVRPYFRCPVAAPCQGIDEPAAPVRSPAALAALPGGSAFVGWTTDDFRAEVITVQEYKN